MRLKLLAALFLLLLSGCASTVTIQGIQSLVQVTAKTDRPVAIELIAVAPGAAQNYFFFPLAPNVIAGTPMGAPQHLYNLRYQEEFTALLATELVRTGVATGTASSDQTHTRALSIKVAFLRAVFNPNFNQYMLDVAVGFSDHGNGFIKRYQVRSTEKENVFQTLNNDANEARVKVSANLLDHILRDIDAFIGGAMPKGALDPTTIPPAHPPQPA